MKNNKNTKKTNDMKNLASCNTHLALLLLALLSLGGMKAWGDNWPHRTTNVTTWNTTTTYYLYSSDEEVGSTGAYKFYVLNSNEDPSTYDFSSQTAYDAISPILLNGGGNSLEAGSGIRVTLVFNTTKPVGFVGFFCITDGTLEMKLGQYYNNTGVTLKRTGGHSSYSNNNYNCPFTIPDNQVKVNEVNLNGVDFNYNDNEKDLNAQKIIITGVDEVISDTTSASYASSLKRQFVIDGGCNLVLTETNPETASADYTVTSSTQGKTTFFRIMCGTLELKNVTLQNCYATSGGFCGGIYVITNNNNNTRKSGVKVDMEHCWVHHIANSFSAVYIQYGITAFTGSDASRPTVTIRNSKFSDCYSTTKANAAVRSFSNGLCDLKMDKCTMWNNYGGGVRWQSTRPCTATFNNCLIKKNKTYTTSSTDGSQGGGGGLLIKSSAVINGCLIKGNWAQTSGGGIYYSTFEENTGGTGYTPQHGLLQFDQIPELGTTIIEDNEALQNGGGIAIMAQRMKVSPYYYGYDGSVQTGQYTMTFHLNGATVRNNTAHNGDGGGVYISRAENASFYGTTCNLDYGQVYGNKALNGNGGGVCIVSPNTYSGTTPDNIYPKDITVITGINGGSNKIEIHDNKAKNGAGVYVKAYPITYNGTTSAVNTTLYDGTDILTNTANEDGGGLYVEQGSVTIEGNSSTNNPVIHKNIATTGHGGGIYLNTGNINMKSTTIGGDATAEGNNANLNGGGIYLNFGNVSINPNEDEANPSKISHNTAGLDGGGIYVNQGQVYAYGNRSNGTHVEITHNEATNGSGGGIFCMGNSGSTDYDIRLRRVTLSNNKATSGTGNNGCGGGIYLQQGKISVINGTISGNTANISGGGIYTYQGDIHINPTQDEPIVSSITGNTAGQNGGGINTHEGIITINGTPEKMITIANNEATNGSGGGIFCMGRSGGSLNTTYITIQHAYLRNNKAVSGTGTSGTAPDPVVSNGCGGGMYLQHGEIDATHVIMQNNFANRNGGAINNHEGFVDIWGCTIGGSGYYDGSHTTGEDLGNKAGNSGGGIYTNKGDIDVEDYVNNVGGITRYESKITYNEAAENGGGLDTHSGTITINDDKDDDQIEISHNKAKKGGGIYANQGTIIVFNANIDNNMATENGGGINNHAGNIMLYGGTLSNNHADTGHGGGAYTNVGDIDIFPFPETSTDSRQGTMIYNNLALKNGGAFNNHTGRIDARYATLYNNTASQGNGGGIFCEGPHSNATGYTIRLLGSQLVQNKTRGQDGTAAEPTGRGGGIFLKYGDIYAHDSRISNNSANLHGGGINNYEGNLLAYGCNIENNTALEGKGGGIYVNKGTIVTGPCFNGTVSQSTVIKNNVANDNGGGIDNNEGSITINGDHITDNTSLNGNGGGIYIANGNIDMHGGLIKNNNAASGDGGGVWSGGGTFNIQKRDDNPEPTVTILDADVSRDGSNLIATIHYHVVDKGNNSGTSPAHGIYWGTTSPYSHSYTYSTTSTDYEGSVCDGSASGYKVIIKTGITAGTTYKVKAFYKYTSGGMEYEGLSEEATFVAFDAKPTVQTGSVSNLTRMDGSTTKYQVEVNGKVLDEGTGTLSAKGIEWKKEGGTYTQIVATEELDFFTVTLDNMDPSTTYIVRAYATNSNGTAYGDEVSFTTPKDVPDMGSYNVVVSNVTSNSASFSFTMPSGTSFDSKDAGSIKTYGFVLSTDDDPELLQDNTVVGTVTSGTTTFTANETSLSPATCYYVRAFASTTSDQIVQQNMDQYAITSPTQFFTPSADGSPVVRAIRITDIMQHAATITCKIYSGYTAGTTTYGVHVDNLSPNYFTSTDYNSSDSTYTITLSGLTAGTTYYLKAYATNDGGTTYAYGNGYNFTALPIELPHVIISSIEDITKTSANVVCHFTEGGGDITDWGVKYSTNSDMSSPTDVNKPGTTLSGNSFTANLTSLSAHTTYYVQAYATNSAGIHTCQAVSFMTDYDKPTVDNVTLSAITFDGSQNSSTVSYQVTPYTGTTVKTHGVAWSTLPNPTRRESEVSNTHFEETEESITEATTSTQTRTQAYPNTKYYVRAYASTETAADGELADIVYSSETSFISLPVVTTSSASDINSTSATLNGTIVSRDPDHHLLKYGVCWGTSNDPTNEDYPTKRDGYCTEGDITSASSTSRPFSLEATGLTAGTTYYFRAYALNENTGTECNIAYGSLSSSSFTTKAYTVIVSASPAEGGTAGNSFGLNAGETKEVTATPNTGYSFDSWTVTGEDSSVSNTSNATTTFTMGIEDATLTANFTLNSHTVTVAAGTGGTVTGDGTFNYGASVTVTATANTGYEFVNWTNTSTGEEVSDEASYNFTMPDEDISLTANFSSRRSAQASPSGASTGSATLRPRDIYPAPAHEPWDWDEEDVYGIAYGKKSDKINEKINQNPSLMILEDFGEDFHKISALQGTTEKATEMLEDVYGIAYGKKSDKINEKINQNPSLMILEDSEKDFEAISALQGITAMSDSTALDSLEVLREAYQNRDVTEPEALPMIDHNTAVRGGGIFMAENGASPAKLVFAGGSSSSEQGKIVYNSASEAGGGIYIDTTAMMHMKGHCVVNANHVPEGKDGGGIYLKGRLYVGETGTSASANGLIVNQNFAMNYFSETGYNSNSTTYTSSNKKFLNNVCLMRHTYSFAHASVSDYDDESTVITLLSDISGKNGEGKPYTNLGFHVKHGFCPVIATSYGFGEAYVLAEDGNSNNDPGGIATLDTYEEWLSKIMGAVSTDGTLSSNDNAIFEDTESYMAIHTNSPNDPFHSKYIYLWGCWTHPVVMDDPENDYMNGSTDFQGHYKIKNPEDNNNDNNTPLEWEIYSSEGLAWFSSYVNGLNTFVAGDISTGGNHYPYNPDKNPYAKAKLMNDIDLSAYYWVPIGSVTQFNGATSATITAGTIFTDDGNHHFKGTIDGQGHTIKGIQCQYVSGIYKNGLVGYLDGGTVKNVFIDEALFVANNSETGYYIGGVAGSMEGNAIISACEARSAIDVTNAVNNKAKSYVGGLVGQMEGSGTVHSSMAMPEITGAVDYMGGLVGQLDANDKLLNSFSNPKFPQATYDMSTDKYIGGLVGENKGIVENCYSRLQGSEPTNVFGWLAGTNSGSINYCYIPVGKTTYVKNGNDPTGHGTYTATQRFSGKYGFKHRDQAVDATNNGYINNDTLVGGLQRALNAWVKANSSTTNHYHPWMRTMASTINDDLPIHNFKNWTTTPSSKDDPTPTTTEVPLYNAVGSKDNIYLEYKLDVNELLTEYTALDAATYPTPAIYLYDENTESDGTTPKDITQTNIGTTHPDVMLAIHEDVGILVRDDASSRGLKARVGVTFFNNRESNAKAPDTNDPNWHLFSSAIKDVPMGLKYNRENDHTTNIVNKDYLPHSTWSDRTQFDPPKTDWYQSDDNTQPAYNPSLVGYFPTNTPYGTWRNESADAGFFDFYAYSEPYYHWINFKREGTTGYYDHWHMDTDGQPANNHFKIDYDNETEMKNGEGYLIALSSQSMMMADGTLNNDEVNTSVTSTPVGTNSPNLSGYDTEWRNLHLLGNPYQSYLDFEEFTTKNSSILASTTYALRYDEDYTYRFYDENNSSNTMSPGQYIHPHQGFFVKVSGNGDVTFTDDMRVASASNAAFRKLNYPLVNLICTDERGRGDYTTVEIDRPDEGGGEKMKNLHIGDGLIYARWNDTDYQTLFAPYGVSTVPVRFSPLENGIYTIKWTLENGLFHYVHLIDNITGADVDCLTATEYKFEGNKDDYVSRFKLVFDVTGIDEETEPENGSHNFAFITGDELVVNGDGTLQLFDISGRCLIQTQTVGSQSSIALPQIASGVYLLRLTNDSKVKVQKMVINK